MFVKSVNTNLSTAAIHAAAIALLALSSTAAAQDQTQERLLACDRISNADARLECFNEVVGGIKREVEPLPESAGIPEAPTVPAASIPSATEPVEALPDVPAAVAGDVASRSAASPASKASDIAEAIEKTPAGANSDFGLEDQRAKAAREAERERRQGEQLEAVYSTIVDVRRVTGGRFEARLENGQIWRETEATRTVRRPKVGDSVRITSGKLGSYRMKFNNDNRLASVRRTQ